MLTILVAEDQMLIQKDICRKIEKTEKDVKIVATAINGQDAYEKILRFRPDVLITDIRMPIQSGLELIRRLRQEQIPIATVILSGYRDFEYAKEAMKLNVDEYLLKPVSIEDLYYVLDSLEEKLTAQKNRMLKESLSVLLNTRAPGTSLDRLKDFSYSSYCVVLMNLDSLCTFSVIDTLPYEDQLGQLLGSRLLYSYLGPGEQAFVFDGKTYNEKILLFCLNTTTQRKLLLALDQLQKQIHAITACVTFCVGSPLPELSSIGIECRLLRTQMQQQLVFAKSSILYGKDFLSKEEVSHPGVVSQEQLEKFRFYFQVQNFSGFLKELHACLQQCKNWSITQKELSYHMKKILEHCCSSFSQKTIRNLSLEIDEYISNGKTYEELYLSLTFLFEQAFKKLSQDSRSLPEPEKMVEDIKKYIQANFSREININDIAVHFSITPAYLSRLFKKYSDTRPIDYLTDCRIRQACHYFVHSQLSVKEIAELCGYSNQYYFSKAFKQETSLSPTEYRIKYQNSRE